MIILEILGFVSLVVVGVLAVGYFKARKETPIVFEEIKPVKVAPKKTTKQITKKTTVKKETAKKTTKPVSKKTVKKTTKK